jgi:hypothetical protein
MPRHVHPAPVDVARHGLARLEADAVHLHPGDLLLGGHGDGAEGLAHGDVGRDGHGRGGEDGQDHGVLLWGGARRNHDGRERCAARVGEVARGRIGAAGG